MGLLDSPASNTVISDTFTVTWADGSRSTASETERYELESGVLTIFHVDADGKKIAGAHHYSPMAWTNVVDHPPATTPAPPSAGDRLSFGGQPA